MLRSIPPKYIRQYQAFNYKPIDDIADEVIRETAIRLKGIQSQEPLVSIVLIAHNEEDFIFATLYSLSFLESKFPLEILVVNNNSTDQTQEILDRCGVKSIFEPNQGYAFARQAGLFEAKGKYVISGDTDTLYPKNWVDTMVEPMEKDEKIVCTYSRYSFHRDDNNYSFDLFLYNQARIMDVYFKAFKRPHLNVRGFSMAFRKEVALGLGGYNTKIYRGSDGYLGLQLLGEGGLKLVKNKNALVYTSMRRTMMDGGLMKAFLKRLSVTLKYFFHMFTRQEL